MPITLTLSMTEPNDADLKKLAEDMRKDLRIKVGIDASLATRPSKPNEKASEVELAQIVFVAFASGAVSEAFKTAREFIKLLRVYLETTRLSQATLEKSSEDKLIIKADDLRGNDTTELVQKTKEFFEEFIDDEDEDVDEGLE